MRQTKWSLLFLAFPLALSIFFLLPTKSFADVELVRSDPTDNAQINVAPRLVRMWFSENLSRSSTQNTAVVADSYNHRVDVGNAQVTLSDTHEMDVNLSPHLASGNYIVAWNTSSEKDGYISSGTIHFTVTSPDGSLSSQSQTTLPGTPADGVNVPGRSPVGSSLLSFVTITLLELATISWVGAHLFHLFVLQVVSEEQPELRAMNHQIKHRFERRLAVPMLLLLLMTNSGLLLEQVIGNRASQQGLDLSVWIPVLTSGSFGLFWCIREVLILLALRLAFIPGQIKHAPRIIDTIIVWINVFLGLALFLTIVSTSLTAMTHSSLAVYIVLADWLQLLASAFWIGGIFYIVSCCLPGLRRYTIHEQGSSLVAVISSFTPWTFTGILLIVITGPFLATVGLNTWEHLFSSAYGEVLAVKILLVVFLLCTDAVRTFFIHPCLKKAYLLSLASERQAEVVAVERERDEISPGVSIKEHEKQLARYIAQLTHILQWEAVLGFLIVVASSLMQ